MSNDTTKAAEGGKSKAATPKRGGDAEFGVTKIIDFVPMYLTADGGWGRDPQGAARLEFESAKGAARNGGGLMVKLSDCR